MTSDKGASKDVFDERLVEARDSVILEGEEIVAQVEADQGQGIVLTRSRVIIIKVGVAATGTLNGETVSTYPLNEITAVNIRKGPMGAVIQIVTDRKEPLAPGTTPGNIVIFSDPRKSDRCDELATRIEEVMGRPVGKIGPPEQKKPLQAVPKTPVPAAEQEVEPIAEVSEDEPAESLDSVIAEAATAVTAAELPVDEPEAVEPAAPQTQERGVEEKSPSEETYAEAAGAEPEPINALAAPTAPESGESPEPTSEPASAPVYESPVEIDEEAEDEEKEELSDEFRPNPNLPKPTRKSAGGGRKVLVGLGALLVLVVAGIAIISMGKPEDAKPVKINIEDITLNTSALSNQYGQVFKYRTEIEKIVQSNAPGAAALKSTLGSGNRDTISAALKGDSSDDAWRKLSALEAPAGLAGAKENLTNGMFIRKNVVANLLAGLQSSSINARDGITKLTEADSSIQKGLDTVNRMMADLDAQVAKLKSERKSK